MKPLLFSIFNWNILEDILTYSIHTQIGCYSYYFKEITSSACYVEYDYFTFIRYRGFWFSDFTSPNHWLIHLNNSKKKEKYDNEKDKLLYTVK